MSMFKLSLFLFSFINILNISNFDNTKYNNLNINQVDFFYSNQAYYGEIRNKPYYNQIFNESDRKTLNVAYIKIDEANKYYAEYASYKKEILDLEGFIKIVQNKREIRKKTRRVKRLERKAYKVGDKAMDYYFDSHNTIYKIYLNNIDKLKEQTKKDDKLLRKIENTARMRYSTSMQFITKGKRNNDKKEQFSLYEQAYYYQKEALDYQEIAFGIYMNDSTVKIPDYFYQKDTILVNKTDTTKVDNNNLDTINNIQQSYYANNDPNLYRNKIYEIIPNLKTTQEEIDELNSSDNKELKSIQLYLEVEKMYKDVDSLQGAAKKANNITEREVYKQTAQRTEGEIFNKLVGAAILEIEANEGRYLFYKKHINEVKDTLNLIKNYIELADQQYNLAQGLETKSKRQHFISIKYTMLKQANELLLLAIQNYENAYLKAKNSDVNNSLYYLTESEDELVKISNENKEQTNQNESDNKKKTKTKSKKYNYRKVESMWIYTKKDQRLREYNPPKNVIFRIKIGTFKEMLEPVDFVGLEPYTCDKYKGTAYMTYYVGEYQTNEAAVHVLKIVKNMGYKNAYIQSLLNGKAYSFTYGKRKIKKGKNYKDLVNKEITTINNERKEDAKTNTYNKKKHIVTTDALPIKSVKGKVFAVQLGTFSSERKSNDFKNISPIYYDITSKGYYRYYTGVSSSQNISVEEQSRVKSLGYTDTYIVYYEDGKRIQIVDIERLEKKEMKTNNDLIYRVQIGAFKNKSKALEKSLQKVKKKYPVYSYDLKDLTVYTVGNCKNETDAEKVRIWLNSNGYPDAYLVAFIGSKKITLNKARSLQKNN